MPSRIVIQNITTSENQTIADLSGLTINAENSADISGLFSLDQLSRSANLQSAIDNGKLQLFVNTKQIALLDDLTDVPVSDIARKELATYAWHAARRTNVTVSGIDLVTVDGGSVPLIALNKCKIVTAIASSSSNTNWNIGFIKSAQNLDGSIGWDRPRIELVDSQTKTFDFSSTPIELNKGQMLRVRYERITDATNAPQISMLVQEIL